MPMGSSGHEAGGREVPEAAAGAPPVLPPPPPPPPPGPHLCSPEALVLAGNTAAHILPVFSGITGACRTREGPPRLAPRGSYLGKDPEGQVSSTVHMAPPTSLAGPVPAAHSRTGSPAPSGLFPSLALTFFSLLLVLPGTSSQITHLHTHPCLRFLWRAESNSKMVGTRNDRKQDGLLMTDPSPGR